MRLVSFNVNGIRAIQGKLRNGDRGATAETNCLEAILTELKPDFLCLQEIKTQNVEDCRLTGTVGSTYSVYASCAIVKKGYSGVAIYAKEEPEWIEAGFDRYSEEVIGDYHGWDFHAEGRIIVAKFSRVCIVNVYTPNAQPDLVRIDERLQWERVFRAYLHELRRDLEVPLVVCGDLNCAAEKIDIHSPETNRESPGFSNQERGALHALLKDGWIDSFRYLHHFLVGYTYFSNIGKCRAKNKGWRIDYILHSNPSAIKAADIHGEYHGSDHCPIRIDLEIRGMPTEPLYTLESLGIKL